MLLSLEDSVAPERHVTYIQGRIVIGYARSKMATPFLIPLLEVSAMITQKYEGKGPVISDQNMNDYIKVIGKTVGINQRLTTH